MIRGIFYYSNEQKKRELELALHGVEYVPVCLCKLDTGEIVEYTTMIREGYEAPGLVMPEDTICLGPGRIYSIDGEPV